MVKKELKHLSRKLSNKQVQLPHYQNMEKFVICKGTEISNSLKKNKKYKLIFPYHKYIHYVVLYDDFGVEITDFKTNYILLSDYRKQQISNHVQKIKNCLYYQQTEISY